MYVCMYMYMYMYVLYIDVIVISQELVGYNYCIIIIPDCSRRLSVNNNIL